MAISSKLRLHLTATSAVVLLLSFLWTVRTNAQVVINEFSTSNVSSFQDNFGEYPDWIELYNAGSTAVSIGRYCLSDDSSEVSKWRFPLNTTIAANGFLRVWASGRDAVFPGHIHTNFKLSQTKAIPETLTLADSSGNILDMHPLSITLAGHSNGRTTNGASGWSVFTTPTPGASNNNSTPYQRYTVKPSVNIAAGFYQGSVTVHVTNNEPNSKLRYTLDGNEPVLSSQELTGDVIITSTKVLKVRAFSNTSTILPGLIQFNTYLINESSTLPVLSVAANNLLDLLNGADWIVPVGSMEYFPANSARTTFSYGEFNKHGQDSWVHPQRSFDNRSRDDYGYNNGLQEQFFQSTDRNEFQRLIVRATGDDNYPGIDSSAHLRDDFVQSMSERGGQYLDWRKSRRCIVFANGQYWGVYSLREKVDDADYCEYYYNQDRYHLQFLLYWGSLWAEYGGTQAIQDFAALRSYIFGHDMAVPEYYDYVQQRYDVRSLADYMIINSFVVCTDWLNWNVGYWRGLDSAGAHKKWAYILWDEDATFNHYINYTGVPSQSPTTPPCFHETLNNSFSDPQGHVSILLKLRTNPNFNQFYINRYVDLMNTIFKPSWSIPYLDSLASVITPEMPRHYTRWGGNQSEWQSNVQKIRDFLTVRYNSVLTGLANCYDLTGPWPVTVKVEPPEAGKVIVNSITPASYPWTGNYYGNIGVNFASVESNEAYYFHHWEVLHHPIVPSDTSKLITLHLTQSDEVKAVFMPKTLTDSLVINEINYHSALDFDPGDWVEIFNPQPYTYNAGGWVFKDEDNAHAYAIPANTNIPGYGFLVLAEDTAKFRSKFPAIQNFKGPLGFGFSGSGELLRLYTPMALLADTVHYDDAAPWPTEADGNGPTLELKHPTLDNALAQNWTACNGHGTPGKINCPLVGTPPESSESTRCTFIPNPADDLTRLTLSPVPPGKQCEVFLYDQWGKILLKEFKSPGTEVSLPVRSLNNGVYFYQVITENNLLCKGKLMVLH